VDSIKPTYAPTKGTYTQSNRNHAPSEVDSHSDEKQSKGRQWNRVERRSGRDRRQEQQRKNSKFDLRSSGGRRRTDHGNPSIETKA